MKSSNKKLLAATAFSLLTAASQQLMAAADTVIRYGKIYTVNPAQPWADAIAIKDGVITYVGNNRGVRQHIGYNTEVINLYNQDLVMPGLHDIHMHPLEAGSNNISCTVKSADTVNQWINAIQTCANTGSGWVLGWGFDVNKLLADGRDPKTLLDNISSTRPIAIMEQTSHSAWVNGKALQQIGFDANSNNPPGGHLGKTGSGELNGVLLDTAGDMAFHTALENPTNAQKEEDYQGLLWSLQQIRKNGITSIGNARVYWKRGYLDAWYRAKQEGKLTARSTLSLWLYPEEYNDAQQVQDLISMYDNSDPMMKVTQVKTYNDGITINTTAAMLDNYLQDLGIGVPSTNGLNYVEQNRLGYYVSELEKAGFDMHIHTIGDRGVHESLNAIQAAKDMNGNIGQDRRHRLTHVEFVNDADLPRFDQLNVIADMQVAGDWSLPGHVNNAELALLGQERMDGHIPMRKLYDSNATVTMSSDWDVSSLSPFVGMKHSLQRGNKSLPNLAAAVEAYTINAAYALRQDHLVGSIEVGKRADLTIVDRNIFNIAVDNLDKTKVVMTMVDGNFVHR